MNVRNFLTLAMVAFVVYGVWYFLAPAGAHAFYGLAADASPLSISLLQYLGAACIATGVMAGIARNAGTSPARTAVLAFIAVSSLLYLYLNIRTLGASPSLIQWIDLVLNALFGFGALYFIMQDRKSMSVAPGVA